MRGGGADGSPQAASAAALATARRTGCLAARFRPAWYHEGVALRVPVACLLALTTLVAGALGCGGGQTPARQADAKSMPESSASAGSTPAPAPTAEAVDPDAPGWLGVELEAVQPGEPGVLVRGVLRGSPAERAGLLESDRIVSVEGETVFHPADVVRIVSLHHAGERVAVGLWRAGAQRLFAVPLGARPDANDLLRSEFLGAPAPHWGSLATVQGSLPAELSGLRGRVVVIDFWASWCVACRLAIPTLNAWHDRYGARGLTVVGITTDAADSALQASVELGIDYAVASDSDGGTSRAYRAMALPTMFVLDRDGTVRDVSVGYSSDHLAEVEAKLRELMATS